MMLHDLWSAFRSWPAWTQVAAWVLAWPVVAALLITARARVTMGGFTAWTVLVVGSAVWFGALVPDTDDTADTASPPSAAMPSQPDRTSTSPPALSPSSTATADRSASATASDPSASPKPAVPDNLQPGVVERIVDGDTIWIRIDRAVAHETLPANATSKIRLLEVDTPESTRETECGGDEATAFLARKIPVGTRVHLQADTEDTDRYGRFLRYVWLDDGRLLNRVIVRRGYGEAVLYEPNDLHWKRMQAAERRARDRDAGIWGDLCTGDAEPTPPREPEPAPASKPAPAKQDEPQPAQQSNCHPSYDPCVPVTSDVDCAGGSGDGPEYTGRVRVIGPDTYDLDRDGDGVACDSN